MKENKKQIGIIKWFDKIKGFGVIITANEGEYFIHISNIVEIPDKILVATSFVFEKGLQKGKKTALNCRVPSTKEDFIFALQLFGQKRTVKIEVEIRGKSRWGNPYVKKEFKEYDILSYFLYKLLSNKSYDVVKEYFITGYNEILQQNDINKIIDYYKITKDRVKAITLTEIPNIKSEQPESLGTTNEILKKYEIGKSPNDLLIKDLINYYNENSSNYIKFKLWQAGEYSKSTEELILETSDWWGIDDFRPFKKKNNPPFDENIFLEFSHELQINDIKRIGILIISESCQQNIINQFYKELFFTYEELKFFIEVINTFDVTQDYFYDILNRIDNKLYFEIWSSKKIFINHEFQKLSYNYPYDKDFELPPYVLVSNANKINLPLIERISRTVSNKNDAITTVLLERIKNKIITSENFEDFIKSIGFIDTRYQNEVLSSYFINYGSINWKVLLEDNYLTILPDALCRIYSYDFKIDNSTAQKLVYDIIYCKNINLQLKIEFLNNLSNSFNTIFSTLELKEFSDSDKLVFAKSTHLNEILDSVLLNWNFEDIEDTIRLLELTSVRNNKLNETFVKRLSSGLEKFDIYDLERIYKFYPTNNILIIIVGKVDFEDEYILKDILDNIKNNKEQKNQIVQRFFNSNNNLKFRQKIKILSLFVDYNISFDIKNLNLSNEEDSLINDIEILFKFHNKLSEFDYEFLELHILDFITNKISDNSTLLLSIIKNTKSISILEKSIQKSYSVLNPEEYIEVICNNELLGLIKPEIFYENVSNYLNDYPIKILELTLNLFPDYYDLISNNIKLNKKTIIEFFKLLLGYESKIKQYIKSDSDLNILSNLYFSQSKQNLEKLNSVFKKYNYNFQSIILKFYFKQFKEGIISKDQVLYIINSIECVELSALMITSFINSNVKTRDDLMNLMNQLLKNHFNILIDKNLNNESFQNIFSLEDLVKKCDGRKSYSNITFWQKGDIARYYTTGDPRLYIGKSESIFCEGRFWKSQPFYDSNTKKPTDEKYDFYWCRNSVCANVNSKTEFNLSFENWTLTEINELFQINLDRLAFVHLAGWLNRMQSILNRLKCHDCNNILRPKAYVPKTLGYYGVPIFVCSNQKCPSYNIEIRFTHCRGCGKILDSRECKTCNECKWLICDDDNCGKCGCGANYTPKFPEYY